MRTDAAAKTTTESHRNVKEADQGIEDIESNLQHSLRVFPRIRKARQVQNPKLAGKGLFGLIRDL
jgi:hypothetical protein